MSATDRPSENRTYTWVGIPEPLIDSILTAFPDNPSDRELKRGLMAKCRNCVVDIIRRGTPELEQIKGSPETKTPTGRLLLKFSTRLVRRMKFYGEETYKQVSAFVKDSGHFELIKKHSGENSCRVYALLGFTVAANSKKKQRQDNKNFTNAAVLLLSCCSRLSGSVHLNTAVDHLVDCTDACVGLPAERLCPQCLRKISNQRAPRMKFRFNDRTTPISFLTLSFADYEHGLIKAYPETQRFRCYLKDSWTKLRFRVDNEEEFADVCRDAHSGDVRPKNSPERYAKRFHKPLRIKRRTKGRAYHQLSGFPASIRRYATRFIVDSQEDRTVELDIKTSFWVCVAHLLKTQLECQKDDRQRLIDILTDGDFYKVIAKAAGCEHIERQKLKKLIQMSLLFGKDKRFGKSRLFVAFRHRFPVVAAYLMKSRPMASDASATALFHRLSTVEANYVLDKVLPALGDARIPAIPFHDAVMIPASAADQALKIMQQVAREFFGFLPRIEVKAE